MPTAKEKRIKKIRKYARAPDAGRQDEAIKMLAELPAEECDELLLELVVDREHTARELAADVLTRRTLGHQHLYEDLLELLERLVGALEEAEAGLRQAKLAGGIQATLLPLRDLPMEHSRTDDFHALLLQLTEHPVDDLRYAAFAALESRSHPADASYFQRLIDGLQDSDSEVRIIAAQGLARIGDTSDRKTLAADALQKALDHGRGLERVHLLFAAAELDVGGLTSDLIDAARGGTHRFAGLLALGNYGDPAAIPFLLKEARSWFGEKLGRVAAARSAAALGSEEGLDLLRNKFAPSRRPEVRGFALQSLAEIVPDEARERLLAAARDTSDEAAAVAVETLGYYLPDDDVLRALEDATSDPREDVAAAAREVLEGVPVN